MATFLKEGQIKFKRAWTRLKKADLLLWVGLLVVLALAVLVSLMLPKFVFRVSRVVDEEQKDVKAPVLYRHPLTGIELFEPLAELPQVFGVMIDNQVDAWPVSGIEDAFLVIEAPVEAAIPRFLAFFTGEQEVTQIGPVRSARPYFLDWNNELDALFAHVGGSNAALDTIASGGTFDLNQYWLGDYFWRARNRLAPHNVFTSTRRLSEYVEMRKTSATVPELLYGVWTFKDSEPSQEGSGVMVEFDAPTYVVTWNYDPASASDGYVREQAGEAHITESGAQIASDNVAIVVTDIKILDEVGRRSVRTTGEGKAWVLQDGVVIDALWRKPSATERLKFYDYSTDAELPMNAGTTWIEVVDSEEDVTFIP